MSNRLTHTSTSGTPVWHRPVFPAILLLSAIALLSIPDPTPIPITDQFVLPSQTVLCLILIALGAKLIQQTLPAKAPEGIKALATAIAGPLTLVSLYPFPDTLSPTALTGIVLMTAGWIFFLLAPGRSPVWMVASGLCGGLAVSLNPLNLSGLLPLSLWNVLRISKNSTHQLRPGLFWLLALTLGFAPLYLGTLPVSAPYFTSFHLPHIITSLRSIWQSLPVPVLPFLFIGLLIGCLQKQPVVLGLLLGGFLLRLGLIGFRPAPGSIFDPGLLLPAVWAAAYGVLRVLRGMEQGIRNVNQAKAKRFSAPATLLCIFLFGTWALSRFFVS